MEQYGTSQMAALNALDRMVEFYDTVGRMREGDEYRRLIEGKLRGRLDERRRDFGVTVSKTLDLERKLIAFYERWNKPEVAARVPLASGSGSK